MSRRASLFPIALLFVSLTFCARTNADADDALPVIDIVSGVGDVLGEVTYQRDAQRPWRYERYFVTDRKTRTLGEAVVALRSSRLRSVDRDAKPTTFEMNQELFQFTPQTLALRTGDSVKFLNGDSTTHNVRASGPLATFNESMGQGGEFTYRFMSPGGIDQPVPIGCVFHGGMQAWILVFDHPFFLVTDPKGKFSFKDVPAGRYRLDVYHPAGSLRESQLIEVKAGGRLKLDIELSPDHKQQAG